MLLLTTPTQRLTSPGFMDRTWPIPSTARSLGPVLGSESYDVDVLSLIVRLILYVAAALTVAMGLGLLYAYRDSRRRRLLLLAFVYVAAGVLALVSLTWWPIIFGFLLAVAVRRSRVDLHVTDPGDAPEPEPTGGLRAVDGGLPPDPPAGG